MSYDESKRFERKLAVHTAPALLGLKCASLVSLDCNEFNAEACAEEFNRRVGDRGLKIRILCSCKKRALMFLYNESLLSDRLTSAETSALLERYGYGSQKSVDEYLNILAERTACRSDFPHEIGLFLGYPIEDVLGFIENKGKNYKLCGCWKVYGSEEYARRMFISYDKCREYLCDKLNEGADIYRCLKIS